MNSPVAVVLVQQQQRKHLLAAHREIHQVGEETIERGAKTPSGSDSSKAPPPARLEHRPTEKSSSFLPSMTSVDSSLENMLRAIEQRHMREKSVISEPVSEEVPVSEVASIQSSEEIVSQPSSSSSSSTSEDEEEEGEEEGEAANDTRSSEGSTSSEVCVQRSHGSCNDICS